MRRFGISLLLVIVCLVPAVGQAPLRIYTRPEPPSRDVLDRLNLTLAWRTKVPTDGRRDGIASIQLFPGKTHNQLFVQTLSGHVVAMDAENGDTLWRTPVGSPYQVSQPLAVNSRDVITVRREQIYVLDRATGKQLLYGVEKDSGLPVYGMALDGIPTTALVADEDAVFVTLGNRVANYFLPNFRVALAAAAKAKEKLLTPSLQLERLYNQVLDPQQIALPPFLTNEFICLACSDGTFLTLNKFPAEKPELSGQEIFRYKLQGPISGGMAQHDTFAYVPCEDYHLYAFDVGRGKLVWRVSGSAAILHKVEANDRDVYMTPVRMGLHRVDRKTGAIVWRNRTAERVVACNPKFVYATDNVGNLLVLDHERGTQLAVYNMRDWVVPVSNDLTDRLYFAAHDGSILCLHHRDHATPVRMKTSPESGTDAKPKPKPKEDDKKPMDPKEKAVSSESPNDHAQLRLKHRIPVAIVPGASQFAFGNWQFAICNRLSRWSVSLAEDEP